MIRITTALVLFAVSVDSTALQPESSPNAHAIDQQFKSRLITDVFEGTGVNGTLAFHNFTLYFSHAKQKQDTTIQRALGKLNRMQPGAAKSAGQLLLNFIRILIVKWSKTVLQNFHLKDQISKMIDVFIHNWDDAVPASVVNRELERAQLTDSSALWDLAALVQGAHMLPNADAHVVELKTEVGKKILDRLHRGAAIEDKVNEQWKSEIQDSIDFNAIITHALKAAASNMKQV